MWSVAPPKYRGEKMIFITGDIHGSMDIHKLNKKNFPEGRGLTKNDFVIICGDFGLVWGGKSTKEDLWWQNWLDKQPWTTLFVDGNHENFNILNHYKTERWKGGNIHKINNSIFHLTRGEIFTIEGLKVFTFGGGFSHDLYSRIENVSWWQNELPTQKEIDNALKNLEKSQNSVDLLITHDAPKELHEILGFSGVNMSPYDPHYINLSLFLQHIKKTVKYSKWFMGHYHINKNISNHYFLYDKIVNIEDEL